MLFLDLRLDCTGCGEDTALVSDEAEGGRASDRLKNDDMDFGNVFAASSSCEPSTTLVGNTPSSPFRL